MNGWIVDPSSHDRNRSAIGSPDSRERRRIVKVELLLGGFRIPGFLEYDAREDQVTFTIKNVPLSAPGELDPESRSEVNGQAWNEMIPAVSPEDPSAVASLVNTIATTVLHSPPHGWLRHHLLLLSFQGRRSGKTYTIPLSYMQEGEIVLCFTRRKGNWWKNLRGSIPVTVDLKGRSWQGIASAVADDQETIEREMYTFLLKSPRDATFQGVQLNSDGTPNRADITRSAQAAVLLRIRLQAE